MQPEDEQLPESLYTPSLRTSGNVEAIDWLRQEADGYDRDLKTVSDSLMQERLKVEQILKLKYGASKTLDTSF